MIALERTALDLLGGLSFCQEFGKLIKPVVDDLRFITR